MLNLDNETKDVLKEWGGLPSVHATKEDILIDQKRFFDEVEPTTEFSIEDVRRMPIWAAGIWNEYYALLVNINGKTDYDEWGRVSTRNEIPSYQQKRWRHSNWTSMLCEYVHR